MAPMTQLLIVALAISLIGCDVEEDDGDDRDTGCVGGRVPTCVQIQPGDCVGAIPPLREGERCAGGWVAQCRLFTCTLDEDCGEGSQCEHSGSSQGQCVPVVRAGVDLGPERGGNL